MSLTALSKFFDLDLSPALAQRIRECPPSHLRELAERLTTRRVTVPQVGSTGVIGYDGLLLPSHFSSPISEIAGAKTLLLYHDVVLAADPVLGWARRSLEAVYPSDHQRLQLHLAEAIEGLLPVMPLVDAGSVLLIPPHEMIESAYVLFLPTPVELSDFKVFDSLDVTPGASEFLEQFMSRDNSALSTWSLDDGAYWTLIDPVVAPYTLVESGVPLWELEAFGLDLTTTEGVIEAADYVLDRLEDDGEDLAVFAERVLSRVAKPHERSDIIRAIQFELYINETHQKDPLAIIGNARTWSHVRDRRTRLSGSSVLRPEVELAFPSPSLFGWNDVITLRRDDEVFGRVRAAFRTFSEEVHVRTVGLELPDARVVTRSVGDEVLAPEAARLRGYSRRGRTLGRLGETLSGLAARYVFTVATGPTAGGVGKHAAAAGFRRATRRTRHRVDAAAAGADLLGLLTTTPHRR